jgi:TorA maturation chaperone TorD
VTASIAGPVTAFGSRRVRVAEPRRDGAARRSDWYALVARLLLEPPSRSRLFELARWLASAGHHHERAVPEVTALRTAISAALASSAGWSELQAQFARLPRGAPALEASLQEWTECGCPQPTGSPRVDFVGHELRMMSVLCLGEMGAWSDAKGAEACELADRELRLLDEHVLRCLPRLGDGLADLAGDGFYLALTRYTALACAEDRRHLASTVSSASIQHG